MNTFIVKPLISFTNLQPSFHFLKLMVRIPFQISKETFDKEFYI